jgi:hypothetical protein
VGARAVAIGRRMSFRQLELALLYDGKLDVRARA